MKRKLIVIAVIMLFATSCAKTFTPYQAASRSMKCGKGSLR